MSIEDEMDEDLLFAVEWLRNPGWRLCPVKWPGAYARQPASPETRTICTCSPPTCVPGGPMTHRAARPNRPPRLTRSERDPANVEGLGPIRAPGRHLHEVHRGPKHDDRPLGRVREEVVRKTMGGDVEVTRQGQRRAPRDRQSADLSRSIPTVPRAQHNDVLSEGRHREVPADPRVPLKS